MILPQIVHLVDDTTAGGVMRVLDHILTDPAMAQTGHHRLKCVERGQRPLGRIDADIIVSHLAVSWRSMPMLTALRASHPGTALVHVEHSYTRAFVAANVTHKRRFSVLLRMAYRLFDAVVAVSQAQGDWLIQSGAARASAMTVIPSCVDLSAFRALGSARDQVRVIGAIGRLDRQKGFDTLISAFRRTTRPDICLQIYGEGAESEALRRLAGDDPRIRFMGFQPDPVAAMACVDLVAMPSNWEAYGLVGIEALAARRCLLVNPIDGLVDHIPNGARVVRDTSVAAWHCALEEAFQHGRARGPTSDVPVPHLEKAFSDQWHRLVQRLANEEEPAKASGRTRRRFQLTSR